MGSDSGKRGASSGLVGWIEGGGTAGIGGGEGPAVREKGAILRVKFCSITGSWICGMGEELEVGERPGVAFLGKKQNSSDY